MTEVAIYRGGSEIARVTATESDVHAAATPFCCPTCGGNGLWDGHPEKGPLRCVPCSGRGLQYASL